MFHVALAFKFETVSGSESVPDKFKDVKYIIFYINLNVDIKLKIDVRFKVQGKAQKSAPSWCLKQRQSDVSLTTKSLKKKIVVSLGQIIVTSLSKKKCDKFGQKKVDIFCVK